MQRGGAVLVLSVDIRAGIEQTSDRADTVGNAPNGHSSLKKLVSSQVRNLLPSSVVFAPDLMPARLVSIIAVSTVIDCSVEGDLLQPALCFYGGAQGDLAR